MSTLASTRTFVSTHVFNPGDVAGERSQAAHELIGEAIPFGATILRYWYKVESTFTSAGADAGTIALSLTGWTGDLKAAVAISDAANPWDADQAISAKPAAAANNTLTSPTAGASHVVATVAVQNLTAGKMLVMVEYSLSK